MISLLLNRYTRRELLILYEVMQNGLVHLSENKCAVAEITCDKCLNRRVCADLSNALHFIDTTIVKREK